MRCPACGNGDTKVVDSRTVQNSDAIRRRRKCDSCGHRFTTYERVEESIPMIVKRDGRREAYNRQKLVQGLQVACRKRPVSTKDIEALADNIERSLTATGLREVDSAEIGDRVMEGLLELDQVAYIRFASVYQSFDDIESFDNILDSLERGRKASRSRRGKKSGRNEAGNARDN